MRYLLVGDTHANEWWLTECVFKVAQQTEVDAIITLGDFGWWPKGGNAAKFIKAAKDSQVPFYFLDGNHEDHEDLKDWIIDWDGHPVSMGGNLWWLPRGTLLNLEGTRVLVCGGAASIDAGLRIAGVSWFPEERVTEADVAKCAEAGKVDILLTHDAPAGWGIPNLPSDHGLPSIYMQELPNCHESRETLKRVLLAAQPQMLIHGHYHEFYHKLVPGYHWEGAQQPLAVMGLANDDTGGNMVILDTEPEDAAGPADWDVIKVDYEVPVIPNWRWRYQRSE